MPVRNTFDKQLIFNDLKIRDKNEILQYMATKMYEKGYVKGTYAQAVIEREKVYPTGLQTEAFGVAIPHSDSIHVNQAVIAVCIVEEPIVFHVMGGAEEEEVLVKFIFMLAIDDPKKHIEMLSKLSIIFQDEQKMQEIVKLKQDAIYEKLNCYINH
ncbi:PTS sugar transporter subunit IIA [Pelosinus propionicus]|uniref:PTS system, galactitol-specific IIA component n=1 Tax=Pelosinus propionicus DSM 13327 TaxID=1123291 RepID=A0A1I4HWS7_9FIRM|nr:PTS sugar transporter subunit IIA [Pelosinus propionicus]SFL46655.1 PTS system, galactitol-specific IIA component [Pelosinus propionicus DSM 13327]